MMNNWTTDEYRKSVSEPNSDDMFAPAYQWQGKPHRHVFDLCDMVDSLQVQLTEAKKERVCRWEVDDDGFPPWATGCGHEFECIEDGLEENGFEYCPFCGGKVEVADD